MGKFAQDNSIPAEILPETQYYNLTVVECASGASEQVIQDNPTRHCYFA